jgi:two-component system chemotaxis response regulator CheB
MAENDVKNNGLVIIGGSAGSLSAILKIFENLRSKPLVPIIIVLHRKQFQDSLLIDLLHAKTLLPVKEAEEKEPILPGIIYVAAANYHLLIEKDHTLSLDASEKVNYSRPSINVTFESAAEAYSNRLTVILLSGANSDGVESLPLVNLTGGTIIIQSPDSAEVDYMPQQAIQQGIYDNIMTPEEIGNWLSS